MTYDRIVDALERVVDRCAADGDRIGYFAAMYLAVTRTVRQRAIDGHFEDPARMERFVGRFADRYLSAERAWRSGAPCAESWHVAFRAADHWRPIYLQHVLLGINAHINLDLGVTASEVGGESIDVVRADFDAVNDVLGDLVDGCQGALGTVSPWLDLIDRIGGEGDETLIRFSLVAARRQAWSVAVRLSTLTGDERDREIDAVDAATVWVALAVQNPGLPASAAPRRACTRARRAGRCDAPACRRAPRRVVDVVDLGERHTDRRVGARAVEHLGERAVQRELDRLRVRCRGR
ncbi:MAG: DUF5995 family protein [Ilumatobacteraceae bacterium]